MACWFDLKRAHFEIEPLLLRTIIKCFSWHSAHLCPCLRSTGLFSHVAQQVQTTSRWCTHTQTHTPVTDCELWYQEWTHISAVGCGISQCHHTRAAAATSGWNKCQVFYNLYLVGKAGSSPYQLCSKLGTFSSSSNDPTNAATVSGWTLSKCGN